jgi:microcystin-dependent protein
MSTPFLGQISIFAFNYAPQGWAMCNGQLLPINQNQALFALLGTMYGGNGLTTFALPNLQGRTPLHKGAGRVQASAGGAEAHTLTLSELPAHTHTLSATSGAATTVDPTGNALANPAFPLYAPFAPANVTVLNPASVSNVGGSQPHPNMQPFLAVNFCIALQGIFPSRN